MKFRLLIPLFLSVAAGFAAADDTSFEPFSFTDRDLFPSALIATATVDWNGDEETAEDQKGDDDAELEDGETAIYGDENGWIGVTLYDVTADSEVRVEMAIDGILNPSVWEGSIYWDADEAIVYPKAAWNFEALLKIREQRPVTATFTVTVDGEKLPARTETFTVKSLNDCPFYVVLDEDRTEFEGYSELFAAYVNENHPWVDGILKEALQTKVITGFTGYQSGDPEEVLAQVFAIWNVLQKRGIKYSDISTTTPSKWVYSQTVRFLDDSIDATQANCVDGTVLMASILRKIGLNVYLVMVPGHCLLAFDLGEGDEDPILGLETTMLGETDLGEAGDEIEVPEQLVGTPHEKSFKVLAAAIGVGTQTLDDNAESFDNEEEPQFELISVAEAREMGIMPIASGRERKQN
jgi:hypothetical protein